MEEEVTQRTIALSIRTAKLTGNVLRAALRKFLAAQHQKGKNPYKQGKQTVKELIGQNAGVSNIEINDGNIKSFERVAKMCIRDRIPAVCCRCCSSGSDNYSS